MKIQVVFGILAIALLTQSKAQTVDSVITTRLAEPYSVVVEGNTYYITDSANDRIVKLVADTGVLTTLAGFAGRPGTDDKKGVFARFFNPRGLVSVPVRGGLVVSDYANHTLRLVKLDGTVTTLAGTPGVQGFDSTHFNFPSALATDSAGNVFIADSKNNAIRKLDPSGSLSTVLTGLNEPNGIALGDNGDLWISDTRNHTIKLLHNGTTKIIAGKSGLSGAVDSIFAEETLFNGPGALLWLGQGNGLLVCDAGNHALRRVYFDPEIEGYTVSTYAGTPAKAGFVNGPLLQAQFNAPVGICKDPAGGFLVTDLGNNAIRRIQLSVPLPPVREPIIGWVDFQKDQFGELLSKLVPVSQAVFNNDVTIAVLWESGTEAYFTFGDTPPSSLEDTIPSPNRLTGNSPPPYEDGLHPSELAPSIIPPQPDVTIKAIGSQDGRRPSGVVQARFQFKTANPSILGENAGSFVLTNITASANMWYTTDGTDPSLGGPTSKSIGVGVVSLPRSPVPVTFKVRAFRTGYKSSEIVSKVFQPDDFQANRITFGFESGEGSSDFVASPGQTFFAPVTLSLLSNQKMYTLQFNLTVNNLGASPSVTPGAVGFASTLKWNVEKDFFVTIPPTLFLGGRTVPPAVEDPLGFGGLVVTNPVNNLLAVGWLERSGLTNLYDSTKQDLITYSIAHDNLYLSRDQRVIVGGYTFSVPTTATDGDQYQIQIDRPSATADGISRDAYLEATTDGTLTSTPINRINSIKNVTVGQRRYIVGDVAPFRWFNAGDFGEGLLLNNDVLQVFQSAVYLLDRPPAGSDFFDSMDSSDGLHNQVYFGNDLAINDIKFGDGVLNVDDVYVTFRRSLDPTLKWYRRYWAGGLRQAEEVANVFRGNPDLPGERLTYQAADQAGVAAIAGEPAVSFTMDDLQAIPGQTVQVPVRTRVTGSYPLRILLLNVSVESLDNSPALPQTVEFTPVAGLGDPTLRTSRGPSNFAAAWLNSTATGVIGDSVVGTLKFVVPTNAPATAAYRIHFEHASGSPNGLGLFPNQLQDGLVLLQERGISSVGDAIPDTWRLRYFGSISNVIAQALADPDGDGVPNWAEFSAGTNPVDAKSRLRIAAKHSPTSGGQRPVLLHWPSTVNKTYLIESAPSLNSQNWTILGSGMTGTGNDLEFAPPQANGSAQFFRVRIGP